LFGRFLLSACALLFVFHATATTEIYTLSLHDALPIFEELLQVLLCTPGFGEDDGLARGTDRGHLLEPCFQRLEQRAALGVDADADRKSTRLNSSHVKISYAVFCLKKKKKKTKVNIAYQ